MNRILCPLAVCSFLFSACGGQYDVGEASNAGSGGAGGSEASGGSSGESGNGGTSVISGGTGGTTMTGGSGGDMPGNGGASAAAPGTGGSGDTGGATMSGGVGGSDVSGGTGGTMMQATNFVCGVPEFDLEYGEFADAFTIRDRLTRFFFDEGADPSTADPEGEPNEWAPALVHAWLANARSEDTVPAGLAAFMRDFMLDRRDGVDPEFDETLGDAVGFHWGSVVVAQGMTLGSFFATEGDPPETFGMFTDVAQLWPGPSARGAWMADKLFCMPITPGPGNVATPDPPPGQTRREALSASVTQPTCAGCHSIIDPLGFSMEILAPETGEVRTTDNGLPIDASGLFTSPSGVNYMFSDIGMLSASLSTSCDVARCFVTQLFDRAVAVSAIDGYESSDIDWVLYQFAKDDAFTLEDALVSIVQTPAFLN